MLDIESNKRINSITYESRPGTKSRAGVRTVEVNNTNYYGLIGGADEVNIIYEDGTESTITLSKGVEDPVIKNAYRCATVDKQH